MSRKMFISHTNWDIKTPFVSYSDNNFVKELESKNNYEKDVYKYESINKRKINILRRIYRYFSRKSSKIEKQNLLQNNRKSNFWLFFARFNK